MKKIFPVLLIALFLIPLVVGYGSGWGYTSPADLLQNEWIFFSLIFVLFFAFTYFALGKTMKENTGAAVAVSIIIALFIASAIAQRNRFYGYVGDAIGSWLLIFAILIAAIILIKLLIGIVGGAGLFVGLGLSWFVFSSIDPYDILPYNFLSGKFLSFYDFIASDWFIGLVIAIFIGLILVSFGKTQSGAKTDTAKSISKWLWSPKEKKKSLGEILGGY